MTKTKTNVTKEVTKKTKKRVRSLSTSTLDARQKALVTVNRLEDGRQSTIIDQLSYKTLLKLQELIKTAIANEKPKTIARKLAEINELRKEIEGLGGDIKLPIV